MIDEWRRLSPTAAYDDHDISDVIRFLAHCQRADAIDALGKDLLTRDIRIQWWIIEGVGYAPAHPDSRIRLEVLAARDKLLVEELVNTEQIWGAAGSWGGKSVSNPRVCDLAAHQLSELWKPSIPFDMRSPLLTRERYRADLINTWRERQGLPLLPIPPHHTIKRLADDVVKPKLEALLAAASVQERQKAILAIDGLGLPALTAARELLNGTNSDHPAYPELKKMVSRMSCIVHEIEFARNSAAPDKQTQEKLDKFKGKPLDMDGLTRFAMTYTKALPAAVAGLIVQIDREGDDSGIKLSITLVKGHRPRVAFDTGESVNTDGPVFLGSGSAWSYVPGMRANYWDDFKKTLQKAFDLGPQMRVTGRAYIVLKKERNPGDPFN